MSLIDIETDESTHGFHIFEEVLTVLAETLVDILPSISLSLCGILKLSLPNVINQTGNVDVISPREVHSNGLRYCRPDVASTAQMIVRKSDLLALKNLIAIMVHEARLDASGMYIGASFSLPQNARYLNTVLDACVGSSASDHSHEMSVVDVKRVLGLEGNESPDDLVFEEGNFKGVTVRDAAMRSGWNGECWKYP